MDGSLLVTKLGLYLESPPLYIFKQQYNYEQVERIVHI